MYLFDLDGTLIDSNGIWAEVDRTFLARRGYPYTKEYYEGVAHTIFHLAAVFTKEYCHLSESTEEIMAEWMELAKDNYAHVALKPHVREYLEKLRAQGERMAVFTSCVPAHCKTALVCGRLSGIILKKGEIVLRRTGGDLPAVAPAAVGQKMCDAVDEHGRLAAASSREQQQRPLRRQDAAPLLRIQLCKIPRNARAARRAEAGRKITHAFHLFS